MNSKKEVKQLKIYKKNIFAGLLIRRDDKTIFEYDQSYFNDSATPPISIHLSKQKLSHEISGDNLHPYFAGLLPEGKRFKVMMKALKTSEDDLFTLYAALGHHAIGDVHTNSNPIKENDEKKESYSEINFYKYFFNYNQNKIGLNNNETSLAGVQDKISASMLSIPLKIIARDHLYILKLNPKDKNNLIQNEHSVMKLAKKCGLKVAKTKLIYDKDQNPGLLVERFDYDSGKFLHMEDACQLLNKYPSEKYRIQLSEITDEISELSNTGQVQILNCIKLYLFSYIIGNGDLHAKNISMIEYKKDFILSPAYDLLSTYPYADFKMALKINGRNNNIKRKDLLIFLRKYEISEKIANNHISKIVNKIQRYYQKSMDEIPFSAKEMALALKCIKKRLEDMKI